MTDKNTPEADTPEVAEAETPSALGSTFAERKAARLGKSAPERTAPTPSSSTFAERKAAREKAVQASENKAVKRAESK